jgi:hypothetical protein
MRAVILVVLATSAFTSGCAGAPVAPPAIENAPPRAEARAFPQSCPLRLPDDVAEHATAPNVPRPVFERALAPVLLAVCACVHPGDEVSVVARMLPNEGEVHAAAPDDATVDRCLRSRLDPGRFEPIAFEEGTETTASSPGRAPSRVAAPGAPHTPPADIARPGRPHVAISVPLVLVRP